MITLAPITIPDYETFLKQSIRDYADDKVHSGNWKPEEALERSRKEHAALLPDGPRTKDQFIFSIYQAETGQNLGILWVNIKMEAVRREAFIYNFVIEEPYRGRGYGRQALAALDEKLQSMQVESVGLHVFGFNTPAIELYKKAGYEITNIQMSKVYPSGEVKSAGA
jgi:ribosomal protein S18 acetylase RimI-like enzyme